MSFEFNQNYKKISEIITMWKNGELVVDRSYQRRSVWGERDRIRLIETILLNLVVPSVYFWNSETDPDTGKSILHIVDGQQRIEAINLFVTDKLKLKTNYLIEDETKDKFGNKMFSELPPEIKKDFWDYKLSVIEIERNVDINNIKNMFKRLNLTEYNLNNQERRNVLDGEFASLAKELSENPLWSQEGYELFTNSVIKRMQDVEFCASLILLSKRGIIDQTTDKALNDAYTDYEINYDEASDDRDFILASFDYLKLFVNDRTISFMRRTSQLYTLFSLIFYMLREKIEVSEKIQNRFNKFVMIYNNFVNEENTKLELLEDERILYDQIKKYKQASSEGTRKQVNRMARFDVLKNFVLKDNSSDELIDNLNTKLLNAKEQ